ncbi:MAG: hypothetical protein ABI581_04580 [Sediminibacterium sp.]
MEKEQRIIPDLKSPLNLLEYEQVQKGFFGEQSTREELLNGVFFTHV